MMLPIGSLPELAVTEGTRSFEGIIWCWDLAAMPRRRQALTAAIACMTGMNLLKHALILCVILSLFLLLFALNPPL